MIVSHAHNRLSTPYLMLRRAATGMSERIHITIAMGGECLNGRTFTSFALIHFSGMAVYADKATALPAALP